MNLHVESIGRGPELVLIHGWGLHGGVWQDLAARLAPSPIGSRQGPRATDGAVAASYRVLIPDLPGHGRSPRTQGDFSLAQLADDVRRRLTAPAIWVGWSLGALVALIAARDFPEAVSGLVLMGATPRFAQAPDWQSAMAPDVLSRFGQDLETDYHGTLTRFLSLQMGAGEAGRAAARRLRALLTARGEPALAALRTGLQLLAKTDLRADLPAVTAPALVLHGTHDRLAPPAAAAFLAQHLPAARLALIPAAGHAPFLSHPDESWDVLKEFLRDLSRGDGGAMSGAAAASNAGALADD